MGKWIIILAFFAAGCSRGDSPHLSDDAYVPSTDAIGFTSEDNSEDAETKGIIVGVDGFKNNDAVGVFAFFLDNGVWVPENESPNFMYNAELILSTATGENVWSYDPAKYWSNDPADKFKFFGYFPYSPNTGDNGITLSANDATGYPTVKFTPHTDVDKQVDFLTATTGLLQKPLATAGSVSLQFDHQLTQIKFSAKVDGPIQSVTNVQVTEIIYNFNGVNSCVGKYTDSGFEWDLGGATSTEQNYSISGTEQLKQGLTLNKTTYTELINEAGTMMLIAQEFENEELTITIKYNVTSSTGEVFNFEREIKAQAHELLKGRRMVYQFTIDLEDNYYIRLDAVSDEMWNDKTTELDIDDMYFNLTGNARAYNWVDHTTGMDRLTIGIDFETNITEDNISLKSELADGAATLDWANSQILYDREYSDVQVEDRITVTLKFGDVTRTLTIDIVIKQTLIEFTVTVEPWNDNGEFEVETQIIKFTITVEPWNDKGELEVE